MILNTLNKMVNGNSLSEDEAYNFMITVMKGEVSEIILSSFLTSLKIKGETQDELLGFVRAQRNSAIHPSQKFEMDFIDTCGTGGDEKKTLNISTLSAITLASLGINVAKHGNRAVSSICGSSDLLSELGISIHKSHTEVEHDFLQKGFTFLFAPEWHPSMKFAANVRRALGFRTVFNMIGPLSNPFSPTHQILGVYSMQLLDKMMYVLKKLEIKAAIVCHSLDGFDEFSIFGPTRFLLLKKGNIEDRVFDPKVLKLENLLDEDIYCENRERAIYLSKQVLNGKEMAGLYAVALNAGAGLFLFDRAESIESGFKIAKEHLISGKVNSYFERIVK